MTPNRQNPLGRLNIDLEAAQIAPGSQTLVIGRRVAMNAQGVSPTLSPLPTQLIAVAFPGNPMEWVITLAPLATVAQSGTPWQATQNGAAGVDFDGGTVAPPGPGGTIFTAPQIPNVGGAPGLQVTLRWGAGGTVWETRFDYPSAGVSFGVIADTLNLDVGLKNIGNAAYGTFTAATLPMVGAFMVPGRCPDSRPLRWAEFSKPAAAAAGQRVWSVKPYAKALQLAVSSTAVFTGFLRVSWQDKLGNEVYAQIVTPNAGGVGMFAVLDVPATAVAVVVVNNDPAVVAPLQPMWLIGLT